VNCLQTGKMKKKTRDTFKRAPEAPRREKGADEKRNGKSNEVEQRRGRGSVKRVCESDFFSHHFR